jgi:hypothetical protein
MKDSISSLSIGRLKKRFSLLFYQHPTQLTLAMHFNHFGKSVLAVATDPPKAQIGTNFSFIILYVGSFFSPLTHLGTITS